MTNVGEDSFSSSKVRDLIFAYERQTSSVEPLENYYEGRQRAKSMGNALSYKLFRQPALEIHNILDIEKELVKIEAHLNYYEVYEKETHVAFQEQLFNVLTSIVSIDPEELESTIQKKKELIEETQKLARVLNSKLPFDGNYSYRGSRKTYSSVVRKEEAVVSTTSVKTQEHRAILSSTLNGEGSLDSPRDFTHQSIKHDDSSVDFNQTEQRLEVPTPPPQKKIVSDEETSYIPSVSRLKKFFSFRRDDKPEVKLIPATYSGVTRSQSLNLKTNKYSVTKKEKNEEAKEIFSENDEDIEKVSNELSLNETKDTTTDENDQKGNVEISLYVEPTKEIEEYREVERELQHNVSVSKLKSLFEDSNKETKEGNYMNFTGLLRNVDIRKKVDLNKSRSMSDLKSDSFHHEIKNDDVIEDLSKEIDSDEDDFEHVSIKVGKDATELNNNDATKTEQTHHSHIPERREVANESSETFILGKVELLKKNFESLNTSRSITEHRNEDIRHILHKTIDPIPNPQSDVDEPILKVPIQLRTGFIDVSRSETVEEGTTSTSETKNEDIKGILYNTVEPVPNSDNKSEKPISKVPIQLRTGFADAGDSTGKTDDEEKEHLSTESGNESIEKSKQILLRTFAPISVTSSSEEPVSNVQTFWAGSFNEAQIAAHTSSVVENASLENSVLEEPVSRIPVELGISVISSQDISNGGSCSNITRAEQHSGISSGSVEVLKKTFENLSRSNSQDSSEVKSEPRKTADPVENITVSSGEPVHFNIDATSSSELLNVSSEDSSTSTLKEDQQHSSFSSGSVEVLKQAFENLSRSNSQNSSEDVKTVLHRIIEPTENSTDILGEPLLKTPIQLRTGFFSSAEESQNAEKETVDISHSEEISKDNTQETQTTRTILKTPIQMRINDDIVTYDNSISDSGSSAVRISLFNGSQSATEDTNEAKEQKTFGRAEIERKTASLMNILESPTAFSTLVSSSQFNQGQQVSSSSKVSMSYSKKSSIQHTTSTQVSHRVVSSSSSSQSSELSSQKYLHILKEPSSYSLLTSRTPDTSTEESNLSITEVEAEKSKVNLNVSQENIIDEILRGGEVLENVDEEFEKMLEENR